MIAISLNIAKIPKGRSVEGKNGARYLDLVLIENKNGKDQYGNDGFVKPGSTKEERANRVELPIVGNWKHVGGGKSAPRQQQQGNPGTPDF